MCSPSFSKTPFELSTTNAISESFYRWIQTNSHKRGEKITHSHQGEKSNYNQNKLKQLDLHHDAKEIIDPLTNPKRPLETNKNENRKFRWCRSKKLFPKREIYWVNQWKSKNNKKLAIKRKDLGLSTGKPMEAPSRMKRGRRLERRERVSAPNNQF